MIKKHIFSLLKIIFFIFIPIFLFHIFFLKKESCFKKSNNVLKIGGVFKKEYGLNPFFIKDNDNIIPIRFIFDCLINFNSNNEAVCEIAEKWFLAEDNMSITFKIKDNIFFHNAIKLTSQDVKWTYEQLIASKKETYSNYYSFIDSIKTPDNKTIIFYFNRLIPSPEYYFNAFILPASVNANTKNSYFNEHPVGTGPYQFISMDYDGNIILKRYEKYSGKIGIPEYIYFKSYKFDDAVWTGFIREETDFFMRLTLNQLKIIKNENWCTILKFPSFRYFMLTLNKKHPILKDVKVRNAIDMAINRKDIINKVFNGEAKEIYSPLSEDILNIKNTDFTNNYNPQKAKKILEESGFTDTNNDGILEKNFISLNLILYVNGSQVENVMIAKLIKMQLKDIGIHIEIQIYTNGDKYYKENFQNLNFAIALEMKPFLGNELCFSYWRKDTGIKPYVLDKSEIFTTYFWKLLKSKDIIEKKEILIKLIKLISEEKTCLFLVHPNQFYSLNNKFKISGIHIASFFNIKELINLKKGG